MSILKRVLNFFLSMFGYTLERHIGSKSNYLIYKHDSIKSSNSIASKYWFDNLVYFQVNDSRSVDILEDNIEENTRIFSIKYFIENFNKKFDFYDIGTNYGLYSLLLPEEGSLCLIEPNPFLVTCLEKTFVNKDNCLIINKALGPDNGNVELDIMPRLSGASSGNLDSLIDHKFANDKFRLNVNSIDLVSLIDKRFKNNELAFLKIDIEGMELEILKDARIIPKLKENYKNFVFFNEFIPSKNDIKDLEIFNDLMGGFYCISFNNTNFKSNSSSFDTKRFSPKDFYDFEVKTVSEYIDETYLGNIFYSDLMIFSNKDLARDFLS